jgi:anhydro-N-acetylmuramic acid kinase
MGLNSGTSMDGIDAALFSIRPRVHTAKNGDLPQLDIELLGSVLEEFPSQFRSKMQKLIASQDASLQNICLLNTALGELFGQAALRLIRLVPTATVNLIGSHGQTIWHAPDPTNFAGIMAAGTLQLGEPAVIAARTGLPVVADFRPADIAHGGEGAPLVAFADAVLFGKDHINTGVLNIGGIANLTIINEKGRALHAFDTGPGNMLIDRACQRLIGTEFDSCGTVARSGNINEQLLQEILKQPYFHRVPPKTTGRELFGERYADALIERAAQLQLPTADVLSTFTAASARSIAEAYALFIQPECKIERLILGGGGANNTRLVELISSYWPHQIKILKHEDCGISSKFKESLLFALLAYTTYFGIPNNMPECTGATRKVCLGKICRP